MERIYNIYVDGKMIAQNVSIEEDIGADEEQKDLLRKIEDGASVEPEMHEYFVTYKCRKTDEDGYDTTWTEDMAGDYIKAESPEKAAEIYRDYLIDFYRTDDRTAIEIETYEHTNAINVRFYDDTELYLYDFRAEEVEY